VDALSRKTRLDEDNKGKSFFIFIAIVLK